MSKIYTSKKNIVSIEEFMERYVGKPYDGDKKLTHHIMEEFLYEKSNIVLTRVRFDIASNENISTGRYVIVKDKRCQILIYENPIYKSFETLLSDLNKANEKANLKKIRNSILNEQGYIETNNGAVVEKADLEKEPEITEKINRQKRLMHYNPKRFAMYN